jgi:hypothetical protein
MKCFDFKKVGMGYNLARKEYIAMSIFFETDKRNKRNWKYIFRQEQRKFIQALQ